MSIFLEKNSIARGDNISRSGYLVAAAVSGSPDEDAALALAATGDAVLEGPELK
jgi:hypothetical protein